MNIHNRGTFIPKIALRINHERVSYLDILDAGYLESLDNIVIEKEYLIEGQYEGHPELLSYQLYSTVDYWWILCLVNEIIDPISDFTMNKKIAIPSLASIQDFLTKAVSIGNKSKVGEVVEL